MTRRILALTVTTMMTLAGSSLLAHEDFRVIGTLTKHQDSRIEVKSRNGKTTTIKLDKQTVITRDKGKVDATELKAGLSVVVDAYGDSEADLLALEIRIVPPIAAR
jgi:Domain of unknown function (DUF5666)